MKTTLDQPGGQLPGVHCVAHHEATRRALQHVGAGHRLQQALNAGNHHGRTGLCRVWRVRAEHLQQSESIAVDLVVQQAFARLGFPGGKTLDRLLKRSGICEQLKIAHQIVDFRRMRTDNHQRPERLSSQGGGDQRARRPPDTAQCRPVSGPQARNHFGETRVPFETSDQITETVRRFGGRLGFCHDATSILLRAADIKQCEVDQRVSYGSRGGPKRAARHHEFLLARRGEGDSRPSP